MRCILTNMDELHVNAQDSHTRSLIREFIHPMERTSRVVTPTFVDWIEASEIVATIEERDSRYRREENGTGLYFYGREYPIDRVEQLIYRGTSDSPLKLGV